MGKAIDISEISLAQAVLRAMELDSTTDRTVEIEVEITPRMQEIFDQMGVAPDKWPEFVSNLIHDWAVCDARKEVEYLKSKAKTAAKHG